MRENQETSHTLFEEKMIELGWCVKLTLAMPYFLECSTWWAQPVSRPYTLMLSSSAAVTRRSADLWKSKLLMRDWYSWSKEMGPLNVILAECEAFLIADQILRSLWRHLSKNARKQWCIANLLCFLFLKLRRYEAEQQGLNVKEYNLSGSCKQQGAYCINSPCFHAAHYLVCELHPPLRFHSLTWCICAFFPNC